MTANGSLTAAMSPPEDAVKVRVPDLLILQPLKALTPETADLGFSVQVRVGLACCSLMASVTGAVLLVTVLPPASRTVTTGWVVKTVLAEPPDGCVVKASFAAGPTEMVKLVLAAVVSVPDVAVRVYVPVLFTAQPANEATPAVAVLGLAVHVRTAPDGEPVMLSVTGAVLALVLPASSWMATTG